MVRDFMTVHGVRKKSYRRDQASEKALLEARGEDGRPLFAGREVRTITALDIEKHRALRRQTVKPATVNRELSFLKTVFNKSVEWEKTDRNPAAKVRKEREEGRIRTLDPQEARGLIDGATAHVRPLLVLAIMTGLRRGELFSLKWSDVDLEDRVLTVRAENAKSGKARTVPLNETALRVLEQLPRFADFVLPNLKTGRRLVDVKRAFGTACRRAGIKDLHFHDLRHTAATWLIEAGADLVTVAQVLGHSSIDITKKYRHPSEQMAREAVERLAQTMQLSSKNSRPSSSRAMLPFGPAIN
jgi:integrase